MGTLGTGIVTSVAFHLLFIFQVVFCLSLTIIFSILDCFKPKVKVGVVEQLLIDEEGRKILRPFLEIEFSTENMTCWDDIEKYKK